MSRRALFCSLILSVLVLFVAGCKSSSSRSTFNASSPSESQAPATQPPGEQVLGSLPPVTDVPADEPSVPETVSVFSVANRCVHLKSANGRYIHESGAGYGSSENLVAGDDAYSFYFKPTGEFEQAIGEADRSNYLLLSSYTRTAAPSIDNAVTNVDEGSKRLLGFSDPNGEFLDLDGNFVGHPAALIAGLGDLSAAATDALSIINADSAGDPQADNIGSNSGAIGDGLNSAAGGLDGGLEQLNGAGYNPALGGVVEASDLAVWTLSRSSASAENMTLQSAVTGQYLVVTADGALAAVADPDSGQEFLLEVVPSCSSYPEAELNAELLDPKQAPRIYWDEANKKDVYGWIDDHAHITAYEFIGGRINYGATHHKFGVDHALGDCEVNHGPQGSIGLVEAATSSDFDGHETRGWPSFNDWPRNQSLQHHQTYYKWMERAFLSGQKIMVNLITHSEVLCQVVPQKKNACDPMENTRLQAQRTYELQDYVDAQSGGPGKGWFQVVTSPAQTREVIADGKMAVVIGIEMAKVLNCGEFLDQAECTRDQVKERLDEIYDDLGIRLIFPVHKFDNAFGGHLPHSGFALGPVLSAGNLLETGHPLEVEYCGDDSVGDDTGLSDAPNEPRTNPVGIFEYLIANIEYLQNQLPPPIGPQATYDPGGATTNLCNIRGLTPMGVFLLDELVARGMLIDLDHISRRAAVTTMDHLDANHRDGNGAVFPVVSSHDWVRSEALLNRIADSDGFIGRFARGGRNQWLDRLVGMHRRYDKRPFFGGGIASDVNGIALLPKDPTDGASLTTGKIDYDAGFLSYDGRIRFGRQTTGDRVFDLYAGRGTAHYGLYPDYIADAQHFGGCNEEDQAAAQADPNSYACVDTSEGLDTFFRSAEAYLRMWEKVAEFRTFATP
ncbi:MAG: microsomal dipeptidase-like Zn-dependent dipeptidase, partial [Bacteroidia bacterium]